MRPDDSICLEREGGKIPLGALSARTLVRAEINIPRASRRDVR